MGQFCDTKRPYALHRIDNVPSISPSSTRHKDLGARRARKPWWRIPVTGALRNILARLVILDNRFFVLWLSASSDFVGVLVWICAFFFFFFLSLTDAPFVASNTSLRVDNYVNAIIQILGVERWRLDICNAKSAC